MPLQYRCTDERGDQVLLDLGDFSWAPEVAGDALHDPIELFSRGLFARDECQLALRVEVPLATFEIALMELRVDQSGGRIGPISSVGFRCVFRRTQNRALA